MLDLLVLLDQAKSTEEKMHDRRNRFLLREVSRTSDWAFPARSGFTTFCHRKVAPKVSAEHLRRDRTEQCGICGALRQKGHEAILVDIFCGVENVDWENPFPAEYDVEKAAEYMSLSLIHI